MELPRLKAVYEKFRSQGFQLVAIDETRDTTNAQKFIRENNLPYRFVENGDGKEEVVQALFGVDSFPTSYLIDRDGKIVRVHIGFDKGDEREYEKQILELLSPKDAGIPIQFESVTGFGEDAAALQRSGQGIPAINLGLPTRYAHSQSSVMDRSDYDALVKLVVQMIQKLSASEFRSIREF